MVDEQKDATPKKATKGRHYFIVDNVAWTEFKAKSLAQGTSLKLAQEAADKLATDAEASEPGKEHSFAVVEEAGVMTTQVHLKVNRNFTTSRSIERTKGNGKKKAEGAATSPATGASTTKPGPGRPPANANRQRA